MVRRNPLPDVDETRDALLGGHEEIERPVETFDRIALAAEKKPRLERRHGGDARDAVELALIRDRIGRFRASPKNR